jgi:ribonuclease R
MLEFLHSLKIGVEKKDIIKTQQDTLAKLLDVKAVKFDNNRYSFRSDYVVGRVDVSSNGTGYLSVLDSNKKDLIIEKENLLKAQKGDMVVAKRDFSKRGRPKAIVVFVAQKEFATSIVYIKKAQKSINAYNIKTNIVTPVNASLKSLNELPQNTLLKIDNYTDAILEVLGVLDDPRVDEKLSLGLYNKSSDFDKECEDQALSYGKKVDKSMYPNRVDLTHLNFCTIDPKSAKDFDDAIYYEPKNRLLYVAIADVSEYVSEFSAIDKEAKNRGFSIYFPHNSIPMLPRNLSENICSLKPNENRLSFVVMMKIDDDLKVRNYKIFEAIIKSKRRYDYDTIDKYLSHKVQKYDITDIKILKWLLPLYKLTKELREKRFQKGFDFRSDDISMVLQDDKVVKTQIEESTPSHQLIEEAMLLANITASKEYKQGIFRNHTQPDLTKIDTLIADLAIFGIDIKANNNIHKMINKMQKEADRLNIRADVDKMIIKSQQKATYSNSNYGHFGLGFDTYTHFTSPIRRYSDLLIHRLIKSIIKDDKRQQEYILKSINNAIPSINSNEKEATKVVWDFMDRKLARWAKENINEIYNGIIVDNSGSMMIAKLDTQDIKNIRVFVSPQRVLLFEKVKIQILSSDIASTKIIGKIV